MASTLEILNTIKRAMHINVPHGRIDEKVKKRLQEVSQKATLPGFRPGKIPMQVIQKHFGPSIRSEVITQLIENTYAEALNEHQLKPAGMPKITIEESSFIAGDLQYKAELEVFPEFEVKGLAALELVKVKAEVNDKDVDEMFENLRKQHVNWEKVDRAAKEGDRVTVDFEGFKGEEAFTGGKAEDFKLIIGSKAMIPGFEEGLIGKSAEDHFDLPLTFPETYHVEDLKGQAVVFKMKVKKVEAPILPEVNDDLARLFEVENIDALQKEVRMNMERELDFTLKAKLKDQVIEGLLKHNQIDVPESLIEEEAKRLAAAAKEKMKGWGQKNLPDMPITLFNEEAKKRVMLGLIMNQIIQAHGLKPEHARVEAMIEKMASIYDNPTEVIAFFKQNKERMAEIEQIVLEEQVVDYVAGLAQVKEEVKAFSEVMDKNTANMANVLPQG